MKILQVHNEYVYPGGEDAVVSCEAAMLRACGQDVIEYRCSNKALSSYKFAEKLRFYLRDICFSRAIYNEIRALIAARKPDVAHFHNSFLMVTPAAYEACFDAGVPVVQTLHNYRFLCAAATFFRSGRVCEECLSRGGGAGLVHGCWRDSRLATGMMLRVIGEYRRRGVLERVSRFIALSQFSRQKFIQAGWDEGKIVVKPNFLERDPGPGKEVRKHVLYVGALQPYKGVQTLLKAWSMFDWPVPLMIVGSGPLEGELRMSGAPHVQWLGQKPPEDVMGLMKEAVCVVLPSECYENFPRVLVEAYACGVPVVASHLGAMAELVRDGESGIVFSPGDPRALADALMKILKDPQGADRMGKRARGLFESEYGIEANQRKILDIYQEVCRSA